MVGWNLLRIASSILKNIAFEEALEHQRNHNQAINPAKMTIVAIHQWGFVSIKNGCFIPKTATQRSSSKTIVYN